MQKSFIQILKENRKLPKVKRSFTLDPIVCGKLTTLSRKTGIALSQLVEKALIEFLKKAKQ